MDCWKPLVCDPNGPFSDICPLRMGLTRGRRKILLATAARLEVDSSTAPATGRASRWLHRNLMRPEAWAFSRHIFSPRGEVVGVLSSMKDPLVLCAIREGWTPCPAVIAARWILPNGCCRTPWPLIWTTLELKKQQAQTLAWTTCGLNSIDFRSAILKD